MRFTVAVTRPEPQARGTLARLAARGYDVVPAPLLLTEPIDGWGSANGIGALAITSRTAAMLLASHEAFLALPTFCVGAATARAASESGARAVRHAVGDVAALATLLAAEASAPVVHVCGEDQRGDLVGTLAATGIAAERRIVYRMAPATALPNRAAPVHATMLYSPRTAAIYTGLAIRQPWREAACVALSAAVAANAPRDVVTRTAERPDEPSLFAALDSLREAMAVEGNAAP